MIRVNRRIFRIFMRHSLPLVLVTILLGGGAMLLSLNFIRGTSIRMADQTLNEVEAYYDVILDEMDSLRLMFGTNPDIIARLRQVLVGEEEMDLEVFWESRLIRSFISAPANAYPHIQNIYVYLENPSQIVLSSDQAFTQLEYLGDRSWYESYRALPSAKGSYSQRVVLNEGLPVQQTLVRLLSPLLSPSNARIGVIVLDIKEIALSRANAVRSGDVLTVRNREGELLFTSAPSGKTYPERDMLYFRTESPKYGWQYSLGFYKPTLYRLSYTLMLLTGGLTLVALLIGLYLTHRTNKRERVFIANVLEQLNRVGDAGLTAEAPGNYRNIFDYLNHHVIKTFLEQNYLKWQKEALEYRALQMQINPHFLFNTLDTINWKAVKLAEGENDVSRMIQLLSKLLKYSLQVDDFEGVPLSREMEMTRYYLEIQRIRFRDRFTYSESIDPALLDVKVPSLLFQPILENALNHGFVEGKVLAIRLTAEVDAGEMRVAVANDGKPIDQSVIDSLTDLSVEAWQKKTSLGLANVNKRLTILSHGKSSLAVANSETEGVRVVVRLPLRRS